MKPFLTLSFLFVFFISTFAQTTAGQQTRRIMNATRTDVAPEIDIIGEADGVMPGVKLLAKQTPDILFLDIQMPDGDGFDLLEMLPTKPFKTIFTTASDEHALKAFSTFSVTYQAATDQPLPLYARN